MHHFLLLSPKGYSTFPRHFVLGGLVCLSYGNCASVGTLSYLPPLTIGPCSLSSKSLLVKESIILYASGFFACIAHEKVRLSSCSLVKELLL